MRTLSATFGLFGSLLLSATVLASDGYIEWTDFPGDQTIRETDDAGSQHINVDALPDLLSLRFSAWEAANPATNPYTGQAVDPAEAHLVRIDLTLRGLFNPPGPLGLGAAAFDPYKFGDRPVYGFIEIDLDNNIDSGGELENTATFRFLANAGRFGGLPSGPIGARVAHSTDDYDGVFQSSPQFERSGAEMTFVFCGCFQPVVRQEVGNGNGIFESGESMIVRGRFLERMQATASYSGVFGGSDFGLYDPEIDLLFQHDPSMDRTVVSLVFPLDAEGAAMLAGQSQQPLDGIVSNHASVHEMLRDLALAASGCCGPIFNDPVVFPLVLDWISPSFPNLPQIEMELRQFLDPTQWTATAIVGTTYSSIQSGLYVWTDLGFDWHFADLNHDGASNELDETILEAAIGELDGTPQDADGIANGIVMVPNFGENFSLYDLNNDGKIDTDDTQIYNMSQLADLDGDGLVNGADLATLLSLWGECNGCVADINGDGYVNGVDTANLLANWTP